MVWIIIGILIGVVGFITSTIAARFNAFNTTPFSKYTFSKLCYDLEPFCNTLTVIGVVIVLVSLFN